MLNKKFCSIFLLTTLMGVLYLTIDVHKVDASSTIHIRINGLVEGTDKITSADNTTYTLIDNINCSIVVERSNIIIDGNGYTLNGSSLNVTLGFNLTSVNNVTIRNINIDSFTTAGIFLFQSSTNLIYGNNITNNYNGIWLDSSVNNTISENSISENNWYGVYLGNFSHHNNVSGNELKANSQHAINIDLSSNNNIIRNNIRENKRRGLNLNFSSSNTISDNNVEANSWNGIRLTSSSDNIITRNNVTGNVDGIVLIESSDHNTITQNNVSENNLFAHNNVGIYLGNSSNNLVHHNNLINNTILAYATSDFINIWDNGYPSGGNYWSDYNGTDQYIGSGQNISGSDFIGDTPYIINSSNSDRYPLMIPYETEPPIITILHPENGTYAFSSGIPLNFTVNEVVSWIGYSLDGQANTTITGNTTLPAMLDGYHYVVVYGRDAVGNIGESNQISFTVDTTPPNISSITQIPVPDNVLYQDEVKVNATVTDNVSGVKQVTLNYTYDEGGGIWIQIINMTNLEENIWNATIPALPSGTNVTYTITVEDYVGNVISSESLEYECQYQVIPESLSPMITLLLILSSLFVVKINKILKKKTSSSVLHGS